MEGDFNSNLNKPTSEPAYGGTITVTASTMPSTIDPTAITATDNSTVVFRLDN